MPEFLDWLQGRRRRLREKGPDLPAPSELTANRLGVENNDFALGLYGAMRQLPGNLFFSPFNIRAALCIAQAGASGATAEQLNGVLRFSKSDALSQAELARAAKRLNEPHGGEYEITVANSLWSQSGKQLLPEFLAMIDELHRCEVNIVDFRNDADAARTAINRWVENATKGKFSELVGPESLPPFSSLVLASAIYFKGKWENPFDTIGTREAGFHLENRRKVSVPLMYQRENVGYVERPGYRAIDLVYRGGNFSMLVMLPNSREGLKRFEKELSAELLQECMREMPRREVIIFLPRFRFESETYDLKDILIQIGLTLPFSDTDSDFSRINGRMPPDREGVYLSSIFHRAFVEVTEQGTEAAAATEAEFAFCEMPLGEEPPPVFRVDHPFMFAIIDRTNGAILFFGRISDPTREVSAGNWL